MEIITGSYLTAVSALPYGLRTSSSSATIPNLIMICPVVQLPTL
jgi:hypothetical protein